MSQTGTIKFFNQSKGFGFILGPEGGEDIFVHITGVTGNPPQEGDQVSYDLQFDDFQRDPVGSIADIYDHFELPMSEPAVNAWLQGIPMSQVIGANTQPRMRSSVNGEPATAGERVAVGRV